MNLSVSLKKIYLTAVVLFLFISVNGLSASYIQNNPQKDTLRASHNPKQPVYFTTRLATVRPVIDGKLDDECWETGTWAGDFTQYVPDEGAKPTWPTEFNLLYDDKFIYVAIRAFDGEPEKMQRYSGLRDEFSGDMVGINFDSYHSRKTGFEFTISSWGQKIDLILFNPENWDLNWNAVWKGKTGIEDSAWVAEIEIPLSQLRYSKEDEQVWGLHVWRWINRLQEESDWEYQTKTGPGVIYNFGELRGIQGLKKSQRLEIMPYTLGQLGTMEKEPGNPFRDKGRSWGGNTGLDAKIGVSSNFTVDLTVNPDFGQVESDPSVMNLTAFETFYEEKRPFFLEGLTIFDYKFDNQNLFYSRRIGHSPSYNAVPVWGSYIDSPDKTKIVSAAKFSGTTSDELSVGLIQSVTANEFASVIDGSGNTGKIKVEPLTNYSVARVQKGYNQANTTIGGMITSVNRKISEDHLDFLAENAFTGGVDLMHHWKDKEYYLDAKLTGSYLNGSSEAISRLQESPARYFQRPGADYVSYDTSKTWLAGYGGKVMVGKGSKGLWRYSTGVTWLSPGLELNDIGYMKSSDQIRNENEIGYFVNKPVSLFRTYKINLEQFNSWNFEGRFLGVGSHLAFNSEFRNQWALNLNLIYNSEAIDSKLLRGGYDMMMPFSLYSFGSLRTDYSKKVSAGVEYSPFISRGSYKQYKRVTSPEAISYSDRFEYYDYSAAADGSIRFDENGDLVTDYSIGNPDFNFHQFRSNFVAKWEYRLGSFVYFVWSGERTGKNEMPGMTLGDSYRQLKDVFPNNIFLIKLNYWFSL